MKLLLPITVLGFMFVVSEATGQSLQNIQAEASGEVVTITYDLHAPDESRKYHVELYSSYDNFRNPLIFLTGDHGDKVSPGNNKKIVWDAGKELDSYDGNITFEIRARVVMPAVYFTNPVADAKFKRGKTYQIVWEGEVPQNAKIQLFSGSSMVHTIGNANASGSLTWSIPISQDLGSNYSLRMVEGNNEVASSESFSVKRKIPLALKVAPVVVIGAAAYLMLGGDDSGGGGISPINLPVPPGAPND